MASIIDEAKRRLNAHIVALAGADCAQRLQEDIDEFANAVAEEQTKREAALREENHGFAALLDALDDWIAIASGDGRLLFINRAGAEPIRAVHGFEREELIGKTLREAGMPEEIMPKVPASLARALAGETVINEDYMPSADGSWRWWETKLSPIRNAAGAPETVAVCSRDIHEHKLALAFRDQMVGILGHDLRNPLGAVSALAQLSLLRADLPDNVRSHLEQIKQAAQRMTEMIHTLLDFAQSRFTSGLPVSPKPTELDAIAVAVMAELRAAHPERTIGLDTPAQIRGSWDPARMAQVLSNLVGNALVHGDRDAPVQVAIGVDGDDVILSVSNRGPIIPAEQLASIFEPFKQGTTDGQRRRGIGLGLYIVDQIVRAHRGTITVESTPAQTIFRVRVPRQDASR
jgi:PAS domain S-box-containing protein